MIALAIIVCLIPVFGIMSTIYCTYLTVKECDYQLDILHNGDNEQ